MSSSFSIFAGVVRVNTNALGGATMAFASYALWPAEGAFWGFGLIAIVFGLSAALCFIKAISEAIKILTFENKPTTFREQGKPIKSASLAENDFLTKEGVLKDAE
jgi:hypothetical protein